MYQPRTYRREHAAEDLTGFNVCVEQSDLHIQALADLSEEALEATRRGYYAILRHIEQRPEFATALTPLEPPGGVEPPMSAMYAAALQVGVGPMAAVAGAMAQFVGRHLLQFSAQIIVENGGDIFLSTQTERVIAIQAGRSPLSGRVGVVIPAGETLGVCTSSGTVGPSVSFGRADAAVIIAPDAALADAAATGLGNRVREPADIDEALEWVQTIEGVSGAVVVMDATLGVWGRYEVCPVR